tara:strand:- start:53 stop:571 length:519 start_codon:yes stop_codon:yes gene_type:complete
MNKQWLLGVDPGAKTGWCCYDVDARCVVDAGHFDEHHIPYPMPDSWRHVLAVAIERPKGYGPTFPQVVDCAYVCGRLVAELANELRVPVQERLRREVYKALTQAIDGEVHVRTDATVWAALRIIHGGDNAGDKGKLPDKKGLGGRPAGPLAGVSSHARAALAVAVVVGCLEG